MKITEMNREQLRDYMRAARTLNRFDSNSVEWRHAFKLAKLAGMENMDLDCTGCVKRVSEWLSK
jgi:hypothetical protein